MCVTEECKQAQGRGCAVFGAFESISHVMIDMFKIAYCEITPTHQHRAQQANKLLPHIAVRSFPK